MVLAVRPSSKIEVLAEMCQNLREHLAHPSTSPVKQIRRYDQLKKLERLMQAEINKGRAS